MKELKKRTKLLMNINNELHSSTSFININNKLQYHKLQINNNHEHLYSTCLTNIKDKDYNFLSLLLNNDELHNIYSYNINNNELCKCCSNIQTCKSYINKVRKSLLRSQFKDEQQTTTSYTTFKMKITETYNDKLHISNTLITNKKSINKHHNKELRRRISNMENIPEIHL